MVALATPVVPPTPGVALATRAWGAVGLSLAAIAGLILALAVGGGLLRPTLPGLPDAGPLVTAAAPVADLGMLGVGLLVVARLLAVSVLCPGRPLRVACDGAVPLALAWSGIAFVAAVLNLGVALALPPSLLLDPAVLVTYGWDLATVRAPLLVATVAAVTAIVARGERTPLTAATLAAVGIGALALPGMLSHAGGLGGHALAVTAGAFHGAAMATWLAGLAVIAAAVMRTRGATERVGPALATVRLFSPIAAVCVVVLALSGVAAAAARLGTATEVFSTGYGQLVLVKAGLLGVAVLAAGVLRSRLRSAPPVRATARRALAVEGGLLAVALGVAVGLSLTPFPRVTPAPSTVVESLIGYPEPVPFTLPGALTGLAVEPASAVLAALAAGLYLAGAIRLWRRGDRWPISRTASWLLGVLAAGYVLNVMLARYGLVMFSAHMSVHMVVGMLAPILLALGGPVTLALRALRVSPGPGRGPREWLVAALHSPLLRVLSHPLVAFLLFVGGTYALYLTPLLSWAMSSHLGHLAMTAHFLLAGYLFFWLVLGVDARVVPVDYPIRLLMVVAAAALHGIFGVLVFSASTPLGGGWFLAASPAWLTDPLADQRLGGAIAWSLGEVPAVVALLIVAVQWSRADARSARRRDRTVARAGRDVELDEYNAMLARLAAQSGPAAPPGPAQPGLAAQPGPARQPGEVSGGRRPPGDP